jgi:hypothetical protein
LLLNKSRPYPFPHGIAFSFRYAFHAFHRIEPRVVRFPHIATGKPRRLGHGQSGMVRVMMPVLASLSFVMRGNHPAGRNIVLNPVNHWR